MCGYANVQMALNLHIRKFAYLHINSISNQYNFLHLPAIMTFWIAVAQLLSS